MKTKPIPAIVMLSAGLITSIFGIINHTDLMHFTVTLLVVLIVFYIIGSIIKVILDRNFNHMEPEEEVPEEEEEATEEDGASPPQNFASDNADEEQNPQES